MTQFYINFLANLDLFICCIVVILDETRLYLYDSLKLHIKIKVSHFTPTTIFY
jgi:hypothetical protein